MADEAAIIKERLPIQDVVGSYIKLEKAGVNFKARCPFHKEKTPSFHISPSRNTFYCFGCHAKGDIFEFVQKIEGLDFRGALTLLAEKAGVQLKGFESGSKNTRDRLFSLIEEAAKYYEKELNKNSLALEYMTGRGVHTETLRKFRIGYAPASWRGVTSYLLSLNYSQVEIEKAGLSKPGNKGNYDRFRGRIMFPIFDSSGRVVAFSGRIFDASVEGEGVVPAKYVNSPETELFHKSKILYGLNFAKDGIRKWTFVIVVEGQMDLIMSHQAGFSNSVALSGTALTEDQLSSISRFTDKILLSLDADDAGVIASGKSAMLALEKGFDVRVAKIIGGKDPAEIIKDNPDEWKKIVKDSSHVIDFYLSVIEEKKLDQRKFRLETVKTVLPFIKKIQSAVDREHFLQITAERLKLSKDSLKEEMFKIGDSESKEVEIEPFQKKNEPQTKKDKIIKFAFGILSSQSGDKGKKMKNELEEILGKDNVQIIINDNEFINESAFMVENSNIDFESESEVKNILASLKMEVLREKQQELKKKINDAEEMGDGALLKVAMEEYQKVAKELHGDSS